MKYRITDTQLPDQELIIEVELDDEDDEPEVDDQLAEHILEWWDSPARPGRNFQILEDGGYIILVETSEGGVPVIGVWMQESNDWSWPLHSFPFNTVTVEEVPEQDRPKKFGELRSYPGMNGFPAHLVEGD